MKKILLTSALFLITIAAFGQRMQKERVKLLKTSFITDALELSPSEAEKFWPVYNLYSEKIMKNKNIIERQMVGRFMQGNAKFDLSEKDAKNIISNIEKLEAEVVKYQQMMNSELSKIISSVKILKLVVAERNFNRRILQEFGRRSRMNKN